MNTRTSLVALTAFAALATTALSPTSASAWGVRNFAHAGSTQNQGFTGYGGAPNPAATHPDPHVPGATVPVTSMGGLHGRFPGRSPVVSQQPSSTPTGTTATGTGGWTPSSSTPVGPSTTAPSNPSGNGGWNPAPSTGGGNGGGNGGWNPGPSAGGGNAPCLYAHCRWVPGPHRPWFPVGPNVYPEPTPVQAPVYTPAPAPTYVQAPAPTYVQAPAPTYVQPPAPTYVQPPAPSYTQPTYAPTPAPTYTPAPAQPVSQNCNCLSKSYMQDGTVVFTDVCTKETAMATPAGWQQGQGAPQRSSY